MRKNLSALRSRRNRSEPDHRPMCLDLVELDSLMKRSSRTRKAGMSGIFIAPYHAYLPEKFNRDTVPTQYLCVTDAISKETWPYDYGDDPSFYSSDAQRGRLSWGVCRPDTRNQVAPGDVVVFVAFIKKPSTHVLYKLSAVATVERKEHHCDLLSNPVLKGEFGSYANLLLSEGPNDTWIHREPSLPSCDWHKDWLCRMGPKSQPKAIPREIITVSGALCGTIPFSFGRNYVIFTKPPTETFILGEPHPVAESTGKNLESWFQDAVSQCIHQLTVQFAQQLGITRSLRIGNKSQHAHSPCLRWFMDSAAVDRWRELTRDSLEAAGLKFRH